MTRPVIDREPAEKEERAEAEYSGWLSALPAGIIFVWAVLLDLVLIHFDHYFPHDRFLNLITIAAGAEPSPVMWVALCIESVSFLLLARLIMARIPTAAHRHRWIASIIGLPVLFAGVTAFNYASFVLVENLSRQSLAWPLAVIAAGAAAACAISLFVSLSLLEGSGRMASSMHSVFLRLLPFAALLGMVVVAVRYLLFSLMAIPVIGPAALAASDIWLSIWMFKALAGMIDPGVETRLPGRPKVPLAFFTGVITFSLIGLVLIVPGPSHHLDAREVPALVPNDVRVPWHSFDQRGDKVIVGSREMTLVVGQKPFEFAVIDRDNRVILKLCTDPDKSDEYRGVAMNTELRSMSLLPLSDHGLLSKSRLRVRSHVMEEAETLKAKVSEVIAESRIGYRPFAVTFSFYEEDVLKISVDGGQRSAIGSTSIAFSVSEDEKYLGLGSGAGVIDHAGKDMELVAERGRSRLSFTGSLLSSLSLGRFNLTTGQGNNIWPVPFVYMPKAGAGLFLAETIDPRMELGSRYPDAIRLSGRGGPLNIYLISGASPEDVASKFKALTGGGAPIPPGALMPWVLARGTDGMAGLGAELAALRRQDVPAQFVLVDPGEACRGLDWFGNCHELEGPLKFGLEAGYTFAFRDRAWVKRGTDDYKEAIDKGYVALNSLGLPYHALSVSGSRALIDFTNPQAVQWRAKAWKKMKEAGFTAIALDPEPLVPPGAILYNGQSGYAMRNTYPLIYANAAREAMGEGAVVISNVGFAGMGNYAAVAAPDLDMPTPPGQAVASALSMSLSCAPPSFIGLDWTMAQDSMGHARLIESAGQGPLTFLPFGVADMEKAGERGVPFIKDVSNFARFQSRLFPLYQSLLSGPDSSPPLLPLAALQPEAGAWYDVTGQYLIGRGIMMVPARANVAQTHPIEFPPGKWTDLSTLEEHGPGLKELPSSSGKAFVFIREGAILPMFTDFFETLAASDRKDTITGETDADLSLTWAIGPRAVMVLADGTRLSAQQLGEAINLRIEGGPQRRYSWRLLSCTQPIAVFVNSIRLDDRAWEYTERARVLTVADLLGPDVEVEVLVKQ